MTVIFSKKCELGLQAVLYLSTLDSEVLVNSKLISERLKVPKEFVSKILQTLTYKKIVESKKGKNGGFRLLLDPKDIKLIDIVLAIDGPNVFNKCVLGFPGCSPENPCPVHDKWGKLREDTIKMLSENSLKELKEKTINKIMKL